MFELEISYAVSVNKRYELRKFLRVDKEVKLKLVYNFMPKFKAIHKLCFLHFKRYAKRRKKPSINIRLDGYIFGFKSIQKERFEE